MLLGCKHGVPKTAELWGESDRVAEKARGC